MRNTIVILLVVLVTLVAVTPAYADDGTVKPACDASHTWWDKLIGNCVVLTSTQEQIREISEEAPKVVNPDTDLPTMDKCKNWTRFLYPECDAYVGN